MQDRAAPSYSWLQWQRLGPPFKTHPFPRAASSACCLFRHCLPISPPFSFRSHLSHRWTQWQALGPSPAETNRALCSRPLPQTSPQSPPLKQSKRERWPRQHTLSPASSFRNPRDLKSERPSECELLISGISLYFLKNPPILPPPPLH